MNVTLHIERLILDGLTISPRERLLLGTAVTAELTRLITAGGLPASLAAGGAVPFIPAGAIQMSSDSSSAQLGQQIAQAVYGGNGLTSNGHGGNGR